MTMSREERWLARTMFENRVLKANGVVFQSLFWSVMKAKYGADFVAVRPQGSRGDGGNDGYLPRDGHYFQVYGPVDPNEKVTEAAKKLNEDYAKVATEWGSTNKVRQYSFVFNDKYEGTFRDIAQELGNLETANGIPCRPFVAADLEDFFCGLDDSKIEHVLGSLVPNPSTISRPRFDALSKVVDYILSSPANVLQPRFGELPDIDEKVKLNELSCCWADLVRSGCRQVGHVDDFFRKNSRFVKQHLRNHMIETYRGAKEWALQQTKLTHLPDAVFMEFRQRLMPAEATIAHAQAVDILVAYYFEACDVFDPFAEPGSPNASPR